MATATVAEESDEELAGKAGAMENGKAEAWGAGAERKGVITAGTEELRAEVLKEVERRQRYATKDITSIEKIGLTRMLEEYRRKGGVQEV